MVRYIDLVQYIKENHINWNEDLFDVLRGFFNQYLPQNTTPSTLPQETVLIDNIEEISNIPDSSKFKEPDNGEYTIEDVLNLFG